MITADRRTRTPGISRFLQERFASELAPEVARVVAPLALWHFDDLEANEGLLAQRPEWRGGGFAVGRARGPFPLLKLWEWTRRYYYVGIDRVKGYLTNVSVWDSVEHAHQMDTLAVMLAQRPLLEAAGVEFETITNHEDLWTIMP